MLGKSFKIREMCRLSAATQHPRLPSGLWLSGIYPPDPADQEMDLRYWGYTYGLIVNTIDN